MAVKFKNTYTERRKKEEFYRKVPKDSQTRQDQVYQASITLMAQKFGIDAIISKAQQDMAGQEFQNMVFGMDFANCLQDKESMLNTKIKLVRAFEQIPAKIRKEQFKDNVNNFVESYYTTDVEKLKILNKYGLIGEQQILKVQEYNQKIAEQEKQRRTQAIQDYLAENKMLNIKNTTEIKEDNNEK